MPRSSEHGSSQPEGFDGPDAVALQPPTGLIFNPYL
jgi:hypothetical protein